MTEPAKEPDLQTMTAVGKVLVTDDSTALLLGLLGYSATKLWNTAVWHVKEAWKTTGKIPSYAKMDVSMKQEHPLWYRRLHSQSAQAVKEPEDYTSQTCSVCGTIFRSNRVHRGLYICNQCGAVINADVNGAINILKRYLPEQMSVSWSTGCLAQPAVNRFAWRKTRPSVSARKPGTWQISLPHPRTESAVALSEVRA
ncbi:MAG TPA: zinc ribbon domain-containing protein [Nitrospirota bacterium]|nr:zinc ribbon domain-containing protein [Nitrospirota bacterium]